MRWLFIALMLWQCQGLSFLENKEASQGKISLGNITKAQTFSLNGEWKRTSLKSNVSETIVTQIPDLWSNGCYRYELEITLPDTPLPYLLIFPEQRSSFRVLWNGEEKVHSGTVGCSRENSVPSSQTQSFTTIASGTNSLVIEISNFHHAEGGFVQPILMGYSEPTQTIAFSKATVEVALTGAIFAFGMYHFILFAYRRKEKAALFFGIVCVLSAFRFLITGNRVLLTLFPEIPWDFLLRLDYGLSFLIGTAFLWFIDGLFIGFLPLNVLRAYSILSLLLFSFVLLFDPMFFTQFELLFQITGIVLGAMLLIRLLLIFRKGVPESGLFFFGSLVLFVGFVVDIGFAIGNLLGISVLQGNLFFFFGFQSAIMTLRTARTYEKRVKLKEEFENSNQVLQKTNQFFKKFIPYEFLHQLGKDSIEEVRLGDGNQREMAILFADILGYWDLLYAKPYEERIRFTNEYFGTFSPLIVKNGGFVDKYIGGIIMALFDGSITNAIQAAVDMQKQLILFNEEKGLTNENRIKIGIGIHFGDTFIGIIGEEERLESTVISDGVNLASRLQGLTSMYAASILVTLPSLMMHEELDSLQYRILDFVRVKGKSETIMIAEVLIPGIDASADGKIAHKDLFESALFNYERAEFPEALQKFEEVFAANPKDKASSLYVERCKYFLHKEVGPHWDGVYDWEKA